MNPNHLSHVPSLHVHPHHHEAILAHAVRHIPGANKILKDIQDKRKYTPVREPDDPHDYDDNLKHHLS